MARTKYLIPELGLRDTRRNRRWLAIVRHLSKESLCRSQESAEAEAWKLLRLYEETP